MRNRFSSIQNTKENLDLNGQDWRKREFSHPERVIRLGTSFSGIGAIEHAFQRLGLRTQIQFAGDIDADCKQTYFANYDITDERWHTDIHQFDARPFLDQIDLFVGGAPCQAFSMRGNAVVLKIPGVLCSVNLRELLSSAVLKFSSSKMLKAC